MANVDWRKPAIEAGATRGRGEIGRRTWFRSKRRKAWGFKSLRPHHAMKRQNESRRLYEQVGEQCRLPKRATKA